MVARHDCQSAPGGELAIADDDPPNETAFLLQSVHPDAREIWLGESVCCSVDFIEFLAIVCVW